MLRFLFPALTARSKRGQQLFELAVGEARQPHWYRDCEVPDTIDGRFAVLATVTALLIVRLEANGETGRAASAALTERFIEAMDAEHRQLGMNDPGLGRKVRKLVASLARRVEQWRAVAAGNGDWREAALSSLYRGEAGAEASRRTADSLRSYWARLEAMSDRQLIEDGP